jgi:hypothetical protein
VDDAGNVPEEGQKDIQPEMQPDADLKEDTQRRDENGEKYAHDVHDDLFTLNVFLLAATSRSGRL